jgi:hypothetical protein
MTSLEKIKHQLINRIIFSKDEKLLENLNKMFTDTPKEYQFSDTEKELLSLSEADVEYGRTFSETELDELDKKWGY